MRLDHYLVAKNLATSRTKAQALIKKGYVSVNEKVILKPAYKLEDIDGVSVQEHENYVSRAAYKLKAFLEELSLDVSSKVALDIGASTGGFTQVLLEAGVSEVSAVDVGREQLYESLKNDKRVFSYESCDIRDFQSDKSFDIVVSDVSFISLLYILDDVQRLLKKGIIILLFKPQFEVGKEAKRDKHGVVLDKKAIALAMKKFEDVCISKEWKLVLKSPSQLTGKEGNLEYCYCYEK